MSAAQPRPGVPPLVAVSLYVGIPLAAALLFLLAASVGDYPLVARVGGAIWVFFLVLVISMPVLSSYLRSSRM